MSKPLPLPFGWPCVYYVGSEYIDTQRLPATCVTDTQTGAVTLQVTPLHGGTVMVKKNVRHIEDDWHQSHPDISRQCGAWDYIEGFPKPPAASVPQKAEAKKPQTVS